MQWDTFFQYYLFWFILIYSNLVSHLNKLLIQSLNCLIWLQHWEMYVTFQYIFCIMRNMLAPQNPLRNPITLSPVLSLQLHIPTIGDSPHMSCQTTTLSALARLCQPPSQPHYIAPEFLTWNPNHPPSQRHCLVNTKSPQVEATIQPGRRGFKEPHWMAAKIPHTAPIATAYSEIMIQTFAASE